MRRMSETREHAGRISGDLPLPTLIESTPNDPSWINLAWDKLSRLPANSRPPLRPRFSGRGLRPTRVANSRSSLAGGQRGVGERHPSLGGAHSLTTEAQRVPLAVRSSRSEPVCASPIPTWLSPHPGERHLTFAGGTKCGMSSMRSDGAAALRQAPVGTSSALLKPSMTNDAAGGVTRDGTSDACIWIFRLVSTNPGQINLIYSLDSFPFRP